MRRRDMAYTGKRSAKAVAVLLALLMAMLLIPLPDMDGAVGTSGEGERGCGTYREVGDWPTIHHDSGNSDVLPAGVPGPDDLQLKWSAIENASSFAGPAVGDNGCLYFTATRENFDSTHSGLMQSVLYALDQESGEILWRSNEIWAAGAVSAPLLIRGPRDELSIVVGCMGKVIAFDENGCVRWRSSLKAWEVPIGPHLSPDGRAIFLSTNSGSVYLKDPGNGRDLLPPYSMPGLQNINTPAMTGDGRVILVGIHSSDPEDGLAWAIKADLRTRTWKMEWSYENVNGESETSPALSADGQRVYIGDEYGCVIALEARSGEECWRYQFDPPGEEVYFFYTSLTVTPDGLVATNVVPRDGGWESLPLYFAVLAERGDHAELVYMENWKINSSATYAVDSGLFYFAGKIDDAASGEALDVIVALDHETGEYNAQSLENPSLNVLSMAADAVIVPVCWGGIIGLPQVVTEGYALHYYEQAP